MFTTMNCDFLETKYFYSPQHSGQGGEQCDTLSWLRYTLKESCPNQNTTSAGAQEQSSPNISATEDTIPNLISEVSNSQPSDSLDEIPENIHETVKVQEHEEPTLTEFKEPTLTEVPEKYVLPARSNKGIPPKRYTPEKIFRGSKYPIANIARGNLSKEAKAFFNAMDVEIDALMRNGTWDKCILPQGKKPVGCRWIFTIKYKPDVCKLKKSLYGLKQSPRAWFGRFTLAMKKYGYKQSNSDHTLFVRHKGDRVTCLIIYVGDMIITGFDESEINKLKEGLCAKFEIKNLGNLRYFLGIEVMRSPHGIFICQKKYILDLLAETWMIDCKPADTPMITNQKLFMKTKAKLANRDRYKRMVRKLIYLSHTRPDIAYAVGVVSQFMHQPQVFTDADWVGDKENSRSTSGYFSLVGGNQVTWKSKKQKVVSLSSVEAEFRGIAKGLVEALWTRKLVSEIGFPSKESIRIMSDNKAAIQISDNPVQHDRTKHVEVDRHFIKEKLEAEIIKLPFVKYEDQLADILTKVVEGIDTRLNFTDYLYEALVSENISTFLDEQEVETGEELKPELTRAIKGSRASIIVLSKNYAFSTWCLYELVLILEQRKVSKHIVVPIFYHVEPTHVRKQESSFGEALFKHRQRTEAEKDEEKKKQAARKLESWTEALKEVADLKVKDVNGRV
nr:putative reverse transcriptase, RNA-dependent DNA polymerase [Tanacetum cinerariifolium]